MSRRSTSNSSRSRRRRSLSRSPILQREEDADRLGDRDRDRDSEEEEDRRGATRRIDRDRDSDGDRRREREERSDRPRGRERLRSDSPRRGRDVSASPPPARNSGVVAMVEDNPDFGQAPAPVLPLPPPPPNSVEQVVAKQGAPIRSDQFKIVTDQRKYFQVQRFAAAIQRELGDADLDFIGILRGFFVKNAPVAVNATPIPDGADARARTRPGFSRSLDRDFTTNQDPESRDRTLISYHRTTGGDDHFWRIHLSEQLAAHLRLRDSRSFAYSSFEVTITDNRRMYSTFIRNIRIRNPRFLGAGNNRRPAALDIGRIQVAGRTLSVWRNHTPAGAQSRANQGGMLPNLVQTFQILAQINRFVDQEEPRQLRDRVFVFRTFTLQQRQDIFAAIQRTRPVQQYKQRMLTDRRRLAETIGDTISRRLSRRANRLGQFRVVLARNGAQTRGFQTYPGIIIEQLDTASRDHILPFLNALTEQLRIASEGFISVANRQSFGFAGITTSDLGTAVRIWPGLLPQATVERIVLQALGNLGIIQPRSREEVAAWAREVAQQEHIFSPLELALQQARVRALIRYTNDQLNQRGDLPDTALNQTRSWINDRIASNLVKAQVLLGELARTNDPPFFVVQRAIRALENLNEYEILQAGLEEERVEAQQRDARRQALLQQIAAVNERRYAGNDTWQMHSVTLTSSGMAAYRTLASVIGRVGRSSRLYFEIDNLNIALDNSLIEEDSEFNMLPMVLRAVDLAYNFTSVADTNTDERSKSTWQDVALTSPGIVIFDTTNTTIAENLAAVPDRADFVVMFESLSKHFQLGADKTTLGRITVLERRADATRRVPQEVAERIARMAARFNQMQHTPLSNGFLNYLLMQEQAFEGGLQIQPPQPQRRDAPVRRPRPLPDSDSDADDEERPPRPRRRPAPSSEQVRGGDSSQAAPAFGSSQSSSQFKRRKQGASPPPQRFVPSSPLLASQLQFGTPVFSPAPFNPVAQQLARQRGQQPLFQPSPFVPPPAVLTPQQQFAQRAEIQRRQQEEAKREQARRRAQAQRQSGNSAFSPLPTSSAFGSGNTPSDSATRMEIEE